MKSNAFTAVATCFVVAGIMAGAGPAYGDDDAGLCEKQQTVGVEAVSQLIGECDFSGITLVVDGAPFAVPEPGHSVVLSAMGDQSATSDDTVVVSRELGNEVAVFFDGKVIGPVAARAQLQDSLDDENEPVQVAALPSKCSASQPYDLYGFEWYFENYTWKYNNASAPVASAQSAFAAGASSMANGSSSTCGALQNGARSIYGGSTSTASSVSSGGGCTGTDNVNVIGWGAISSSKVLAYTCNYSFLSEVYEADMKFDTSGHLWSSAASGCASGRYDLQGVATHEFGHAFGLDHVASGTGQVMQASTTTCNYAQRQLGYGDQHGMYAMYGSTND